MAGTTPGHHACVLFDDKTVACWGNNASSSMAGTAFDVGLP